MRRKSLGLVAATAIVAAIAIVAVVFGPPNLANLGNPGPGTGENTGDNPQIASIDAPTWTPGDTWTYDVNESAREGTWESLSASGTLTRTVVSADDSRYNVSVRGTFRIVDWVDPIVYPTPGNEMLKPVPHPVFTDVTVDGYSWYRTSDLAKVKDLRTISAAGSAGTQAALDVSYAATVETTYEPALDLWSFPIVENETWNATSNATIRAQVRWHLEPTDMHADLARNFTLTRPIRLSFASGEAADVVTPAGTFTAIPVRIAKGSLDPVVEGHGDLAIWPANDEALEHRAPVVLWFSDLAKTVVHASSVLGDLRVEAVLKSYHLG